MRGTCQRHNPIICVLRLSGNPTKETSSSGVTESGRFPFLFPCPPPPHLSGPIDVPSDTIGEARKHSHPFPVPLNWCQTSAPNPLSSPETPPARKTTNASAAILPTPLPSLAPEMPPKPKQKKTDPSK